jgi:hypothetical protein
MKNIPSTHCATFCGKKITDPRRKKTFRYLEQVWEPTTTLYRSSIGREVVHFAAWLLIFHQVFVLFIMFPSFPLIVS